MHRRHFLALSVASVAANLHPPLRAQPTPTLFYIDGYHGGARGHMPPGAWRDILEALRLWPDWKLSLDIEPGSWDLLLQTDPEAYHELQTFLADTSTSARVTLTAGTFAQPYGWAISGESNIRQLQRGIALHRKHFPTALIDVYAVQEPCWASCLPQILLSLGFRAASLKNASTAWGGYSAGFDAELVNWIGPDGSSIRAVPRYRCEDLENTWETEAVDATPQYVDKCLAHGIALPVGMCFQDLGWAARPRIRAPYLRYTTWREYISTTADVTPKDWHFTPEDILTTLPWGEKTLQKVPSQWRALRRYGPATDTTAHDPLEPGSGEQINAAELLFLADVPAFGYNTYCIEPHASPASTHPDASTSALSHPDGTFTLENTLYCIRFDPQRGGAITSLVVKQTKRELCRPGNDRLVNEYRGYFIKQGQWRSSTESAATVEILEAGPLRARLAIHGTVGGCPFRTVVTLGRRASAHRL